MRIDQLLITVSVGLALSLPGTAGVQTDSTRTEKEGSHDRFVKLYRVPKDWVFLDLKRPGTIQLLPKATIPGSMEIEESGIRFKPTTQSPEGYLPQAEFDRIYWYNSLFQEVFIPFSEIASVNSYNGTIKLRDGRKYKFYTRQFKTRFGRTLKQLIHE